MQIFTIWYGTECQFYYHGKLSCSKCFLTKAETDLQANLPFVANSYLMFQTNFMVVSNTIHTKSFPPVSEEVRASGHSREHKRVGPGQDGGHQHVHVELVGGGIELYTVITLLQEYQDLLLGQPVECPQARHTYRHRSGLYWQKHCLHCCTGNQVMQKHTETNINASYNESTNLRPPLYIVISSKICVNLRTLQISSAKMR